MIKNIDRNNSFIKDFYWTSFTLLLLLISVKCTDPSIERVAFAKALATKSINADEEDIKQCYFPLEFLLEEYYSEQKKLLNESQLNNIKIEYLEQMEEMVRTCINEFIEIEYED